MTPINLPALAPHLPLIIGGFVIAGAAFWGGYLFRSWMGHARPSQFALAARVLLGGPLLALYIASAICSMCVPTYSTPYALHAMILVIMAAVFPKSFIRVGRDGFQIGGPSPTDNQDDPASDVAHEDLHS